MASESQKKKLGFFGILFWLYVIFVIAWTFFGTTWYDLSYYGRKGGDRGSRRIRSCISNCRVLTGAFEMYNMDHKDNHPSCEVTLDPSPEMIGYYKKIYKPIDKCNYCYSAKTTTVYCFCHGSPEHSFDFDDTNVKSYFQNIPKDEDFKRLYEIYKKETRKKRVREYISSLPSKFLCGLVLPFFLVFGLPFILFR